ncbi:cullin-3A-like [Olea europaea subsp. europaea]|uniref:Cullin-3A-like n=1 Tax=Olea europaea subsp. europaea TaxID=158383 RepID=A0A8S0TE40_OLEEU|nr:cullin-3A-like [Olea europaea subsp. europaea]
MLRLLHMKNSGLVKMILDEKNEDLGRMYSLFGRVPNGLSTIRDVMTSHIRNTGEQLITDPEKLKNHVEFVDSLLEKRNNVELRSGSGVVVHKSESEIFRNKTEGGGGQEAPDPGFYCKNIEIYEGKISHQS